MNESGPTLHLSEKRKFSRNRPEALKIFGAALLIFVYAILSGRTVSTALSAQANEYQVKSAFVYNFFKFVSWPQEALPNQEAELTLCVMGSDPLGNTLESLNGKEVKGRKLKVKKIRKKEEADSCQALYICRSEQARAEKILKGIKGPVLTIGDMKQFASSGGVINLVIVNKRVSFEINTDAAAQAGIQISSQLLKLARIVGTERGKR
ncbi:MAG: hypothetical protein A4E66_00367 [Syntrophus sp. PtaB.Bin001]|nr:MAG: hypothetical protein A4E66_00367 [Syntrophus sp. PtaB.Bin001]